MASFVSPASPRRSISFLDVILLVELALLAILYGRLTSFFPDLTTPFRWITLALPLACVPFALSAKPIAAIMAIVPLIGVTFYQVWFSLRWGTPFTGDALGAFQAMSLSAMIAIHCRERDPIRFLWILYIASMFYIALHAYYLFTIDVDFVARQQSLGQGGFASSISRTHAAQDANVDDEYKLAVSGFFMAYAVIFSASLSRTINSFWRFVGVMVAIIFSAYILVVSDSRFNTFSTIASCAYLLVPASIHRKAQISMILAAVGIAIYTTSAFFQINLFNIIAYDRSGAIRADEFATSNPVFLSNPVLGIGLWGGPDDLKIPYHGVYVAPSDLGWYGTALQHGLIGIILLLICHFYFYKLIVRFYFMGFSKLSLNVLNCCFLYLALVQYLSPQFWEGAGAVLISMTIAYWPEVRSRIVRHDRQSEITLSSLNGS